MKFNIYNFLNYLFDPIYIIRRLLTWHGLLTIHLFYIVLFMIIQFFYKSNN